ncbi:MAG: ROK family protein [Lewinella sp.]|nr:ROK family protein [Lewinella sp.]
MATPIWGIDLGGTKTEGVVMQRDGQVLARRRLPTERDGGYDHIIGQISSVIELLKKDTGLAPERLGIGTPGAIDPGSGLMKNSNTTVLNNRPFHTDLSTALGLPLVMANDANCFAVAEATIGAGKAYAQGEHLIFGVIMGTGVGGGIVINGRVWNGAQGIGGEWGHSFLDASGGQCYCGNSGCVETLISGPALEKYYFQQTGVKARLHHIIDRYEAHQGDVAVEATVKRLLHFYGKALANIINILDPTAVILGGGLSNIDLLYEAGRASVAQYVFNPDLHTPILRPQLGDSAGVFGAAMLVA